MLADAQAALIVTDTKHLPITHALTPHGCQVLNIDECDLLHSSPENLGLSLSPDTLANIMYTSGSTGQSKGVVQNHRNLLHKAMLYTNDLHLCVEDRLSLLHSCSFAASLRHIWGALLNGAALFPFDLQTEGLINIAPWLLEERITICHIPASVFRYFAGLLRGKELFPALRVLYVANEPVSRHDVELYQAHFSSRCLFVNALVASEALTMRQFFIDKATLVHESIVPVGYPVQDEEIVLLDEDGQEVGTNHVGEIAVKSRYLALGYWQKPELTRATFVPDRDDASKRLYQTGDLGRMLADGCLVYLGRKDFQVKISGRWIDVAEIEMALLDHVAIKAAVVVAGERHPDDTRLIAYIVPAQAPGPTIGELQRFLHARLPEYMMPSTFVLLDALPLTPTGKVDRLALPMPDPVRPALDTAFVAPRTPIEEAVARIWAEVLGLEQVGMHDNFLALGGHSLLATQVLSRLRDTFQVELPVRHFFEAPTIAKLVESIEAVQNSATKLQTSAISPLRRELYRKKMSS